MDTFFEIAALSVIGAILCACIRRKEPGYAFCVGGAAIALALGCGLRLLSPVISFLEELSLTAGIKNSALTPVFKTAAIGILSQIAASFCTDAGETALAKIAEICGSAAALYCALPLAQSVLQMIRSLLEG